MSALKQALLAVRELRAQLEAARGGAHEPIAHPNTAGLPGPTLGGAPAGLRRLLRDLRHQREEHLLEVLVVLLADVQRRDLREALDRIIPE